MARNDNLRNLRSRTNRTFSIGVVSEYIDTTTTITILNTLTTDIRPVRLQT